MFRKIAITLVLVGFASPVLALTPQEAYQQGARTGLLMCGAIRSGARNMNELMTAVFYEMNDRDMRIISRVNELKQAVGDNDPVVKGYDKGSQDAINRNCKKELKRFSQSYKK
jgi:hypothetical protein